MIHYTLRCDSGHEFDGWFRNAGAFDAEAAKKRVACPQCGSNTVERALMAPALGAGTKKTSEPAAESRQLATADPRRKELMEALRKLRAHVAENAEYVGDRFPEEARRIHHEESEARGIYGEATPDEARALSEEGIEVFPLPVLPEDRN